MRVRKKTMLKTLVISEPSGEAFTKNHLVVVMHQPVGLEVRGTPRAFPDGAIEDGLCSSLRRQA